MLKLHKVAFSLFYIGQIVLNLQKSAFLSHNRIIDQNETCFRTQRGAASEDICSVRGNSGDPDIQG